MRVVPTLRFGQTLAAADPPTGRVCVVVPAYNEARVIAGLVRSLRDETYPQVRFVLALDRCTDDTAALARAAIGRRRALRDRRNRRVPGRLGRQGPRGARRRHALARRGGCRFPAVRRRRHALRARMHRGGARADAAAQARSPEPPQHADVRHVVRARRADGGGLELMRRFPLTRANGVDGPRARSPTASSCCSGAMPTKPSAGTRPSRTRCSRTSRSRAASTPAKRTAGVFMADGLFHCRMYARLAAVPARLEADLHRGGRAARRGACVLVAAGPRGWARSFPLWMLAAGPLGALIIAHDAARGWTVLALCRWRRSSVWLGALAADHGARARAGVDGAAAHRRRLADRRSAERGRPRRPRAHADAMGRARVRFAPTRPERIVLGERAGAIATRAADSRPHARARSSSASGA